MKRLTLALLLGLATQAAWSAGNNYADLERKEQQRLEQARRDHARRQQDSARANRAFLPRAELAAPRLADLLTLRFPAGRNLGAPLG